MPLMPDTRTELSVDLVFLEMLLEAPHCEDPHQYFAPWDKCTHQPVALLSACNFRHWQACQNAVDRLRYYMNTERGFVCTGCKRHPRDCWKIMPLP